MISALGHYLAIFLCSVGLGLASSRVGVPLYALTAAIIVVWLLAVIPVQ